ncbi:hypothetical protein [Riemerella anatipestifer]|uniref:hypothetical protein n=1 Tax=Riemerella anatipestifer TaxID=34085 RepID=UPI0021D57A28|nr:hypothetical protein [Riemerella anatipestifer]MCU7543241.1 hypothetical protein [Riemerella anatipestifer]MCW0514055.1 hypothetical protein [Riemerella anatipestifer]MDY3548893.1 hypothetical protein [Riemerella anatipestifer]
MNQIDLYNKIADIALNAKRPIKISELANILGIEKNGRNIHNYIRGAYGHFKRNNDQITAGKISGVFTDENGNYVY